jgi:hypothetical protein
MGTNDSEYSTSSFPPFVPNPNADDARLMMNDDGGARNSDRLNKSGQNKNKHKTWQ